MMELHLIQPMQAFAITAVLITVTILYRKLYDRRFRQTAHLPQLPSSLLWGHLKLFDEYSRRGKLDRHPGKLNPADDGA